VGASLLGVFFAHKKIHLIKIPENSALKVLSYLGRHSLLIYLIHRPIVFGLLSLCKMGPFGF
jgi:uncharacterized membrane protein